MVEIFGKFYYIDLESVTDRCRTGKIINDETENDTFEINVFKYEIIKMCIDRVLNEFDEIDEEIGVFAQKETSTSFKMAFNTLIKNNIIIEDDEQ
jgi:hypothetical protein